MNEKRITELEKESRARFLGVSVDSDFYVKVRQVAQAERISTSQLLRKAVSQYIVKAKG